MSLLDFLIPIDTITAMVIIIVLAFIFVGVLKYVQSKWAKTFLVFIIGIGLITLIMGVI